MKARMFTVLLIWLPACLFAHSPVKLKIEGADKPGGKIYVSVFDTEKAYNERIACKSFTIEGGETIITAEINLPDGEYVFTVYQDANGNKKLDTSLIGIPREKFGFSNYEGKNAPGSFKRHKIKIVDNRREVCIKLYRI